MTPGMAEFGDATEGAVEDQVVPMIPLDASVIPRPTSAERSSTWPVGTGATSPARR